MSPEELIIGSVLMTVLLLAGYGWFLVVPMPWAVFFAPMFFGFILAGINALLDRM